MSENKPPQRDAWAELRRLTPSRIGLARAGGALTTPDMLSFDLACARAKDAVARVLDGDAIAADLAPLASLRVRSRAHNRRDYLRDPDLGRRLDADSLARLAPRNDDLVIVVGDGLSADAARRHAPAVIAALRGQLNGLTLGPIVIAEQARVALSDEIGERMRARAVAILLGERPGLSTPASLGIYLTIGPRVGNRDAHRNCISNVHENGLAPEVAARKLAWLLHEGLRLGMGGVSLKDREDEDTRLASPTAPPAHPDAPHPTPDASSLGDPV